MTNTKHINKFVRIKIFWVWDWNSRTRQRGGATDASEALSVGLNGMLVRVRNVTFTVSEAMSVGRFTEKV